MKKGNKGEWSEVYVFLKLLADGNLNAADKNLAVLPNIFYPIIKIIRQEPNSKREFLLNGNIEVYDGNTNALLLIVPTSEFVQKSKELLDNLKKASGRSFSFPAIEAFLNSIDVYNLAAAKTDKADIRLVVHDLNTGQKPTLGFSIKSMLGKDSTLFNPGPGTNFIFKIHHPANQILDFNQFNIDTLRRSKLSSRNSKLSIRIQELELQGFNFKFDSIQSENLKLNLELIDSKLPEILASVIYLKFRSGVSKLSSLLSQLKLTNPLNFDLRLGHPFYDVKLKAFLTESALGMTAESVWTGVYDATGGIIIVKQDGEVVCYHIYNRNDFQEFLINNTKLEQPSTSEDDSNPGFARIGKSIKPYKYGWIYQENGELYMKLNLQIRFT